jgi:peroxin-7
LSPHSFDTNDALYDLAWSELNENQLVVATGDGSIKLFDLSLPDFPVMNFHEHKREVFCVTWNPSNRDTFLSSSWDGSVRLWSPTRTQSLRTLPVGTCTYSASFNPHNSSVISTASSDGQIRLFDLRTPVSAKYHLTSMLSVPGGAEILTHDWSKYREPVLAAAGVDKLIRVFDVRNPQAGPVSVMQGHEYAVRRLAWSPHASDVIVSASYDMTVRVWSDGSTMQHQSAAMSGGGSKAGLELGLMNRHTEFATGVDWCLFGAGGWVASVGWDERVLLWDAHATLRR